MVGLSRLCSFNAQKLPKIKKVALFQKLLPEFLDVFMWTLLKVLLFVLHSDFQHQSINVARTFLKRQITITIQFFVTTNLPTTCEKFVNISVFFYSWGAIEAYGLVLSSVFSCLETLMKPRTRFWNSTWNWAFKSCSLVWVKLKDTLKSNIIKHYLRLCSEGWSSIKKFAEIEICNEIVDIFMLDMSSKHIFYPKIAEEGKNCSQLEETQKVAQKLPGTIGTGLTNGINQVGKMSNFIRCYNLSFLVVKILLFNLHVLG